MWFNEPKQAWIGLGVLWIVGFIGALMRFIMAFFQTRISEDLGIGRGFISMAWSTNLLIAALCAPLGGWLADRYGPKNVLLASSVLGAAGTGIVAFGHQEIVFFLGYGVVCGFAGIGTTTVYLLLFDWFRHHRAKATGLLASASSLGLAVCTPIFVSASGLTWKDAFLASFALGIVVALPVIYWGIREPQPRAEAAGAAATEEPEEAESRIGQQTAGSRLRANAAFLPLFLIVAGSLFACGFNMGTVEMNLVAIHQLANVPPGMIALSMSVLGIMEIAGSLLMGYLLDRIHKLVMMTVLYGIRILGFSLLYLHLGWSPVLFAVAFGATYLSTVPGGLLVVKQYFQGHGKQTGWLLLFHQAGGILGAFVGGVSFDYYRDYQVLIGVDVLMCALAALGYFYLYATRKRGLRLRLA
ncbi:MFS transporter [Cohnella caldifontis]|uniref:MFS transporter n=1 Tax=Cohnella caldifontis TaxID=3027471 RepID=UPI0023EADC43|nr:MFS transporter [Cohnella sp. YIM B05605]